MKDRTNPCIYYVCAHGTCQKGRQDVTVKKCKNCAKYHARKNYHPQEPVKLRRERSKARSERRMDW